MRMEVLTSANENELREKLLFMIKKYNVDLQNPVKNLTSVFASG